jgi:hypothetical protein
MQITIETDEVTIIRRHHAHRIWCRECAREVEVVGLEEAGVLAGMTQPALLKAIGTYVGVHFLWIAKESSNKAVKVRFR